MTTENTLPEIGYNNILYVTDLSESGRHAFPHAAHIARHFNSELTVYHVVDSGNLENLMGYMNEQLWEVLAKESLENARKILVDRKRDNVEIINDVQQFCEETISSLNDKPVISYQVKVDMGEPLECILNEAHSGDYDLLIISKHGHRLSVKDAMMGDTARRVSKRCKIPVMVVPVP